MLGRVIIAVTALFAAGCANTQTVIFPFEINSRREFPPDQRAQVWSRAVNAFDWTGRIPAVSDEQGGLLQSVEQGSMIQCTEYRVHPRRGEPSLCKAIESTRLTIGGDGVASLRIAGKIKGVVPAAPNPPHPMSDRDLKQQQARVDRWLDFVVGKNDYKPEPPNPPLSPAWTDF